MAEPRIQKRKQMLIRNGKSGPSVYPSINLAGKQPGKPRWSMSYDNAFRKLSAEVAIKLDPKIRELVEQSLDQLMQVDPNYIKNGDREAAISYFTFNPLRAARLIRDAAEKLPAVQGRQSPYLMEIANRLEASPMGEQPYNPSESALGSYFTGTGTADIAGEIAARAPLPGPVRAIAQWAPNLAQLGVPFAAKPRVERPELDALVDAASADLDRMSERRRAKQLSEEGAPEKYIDAALNRSFEAEQRLSKALKQAPVRQGVERAADVADESLTGNLADTAGYYASAVGAPKFMPRMQAGVDLATSLAGRIGFGTNPRDVALQQTGVTTVPTFEESIVGETLADPVSYESVDDSGNISEVAIPAGTQLTPELQQQLRDAGVSNVRIQGEPPLATSVARFADPIATAALEQRMLAPIAARAAGVGAGGAALTAPTARTLLRSVLRTGPVVLGALAWDALSTKSEEGQSAIQERMKQRLASRLGQGTLSRVGHDVADLPMAIATGDSSSLGAIAARDPIIRRLGALIRYGDPSAYEDAYRELSQQQYREIEFKRRYAKTLPWAHSVIEKALPGADPDTMNYLAQSAAHDYTKTWMGEAPKERKYTPAQIKTYTSLVEDQGIPEDRAQQVVQFMQFVGDEAAYNALTADPSAFSGLMSGEGAGFPKGDIVKWTDPSAEARKQIAERRNQREAEVQRAREAQQREQRLETAKSEMQGRMSANEDLMRQRQEASKSLYSKLRQSESQRHQLAKAQVGRFDRYTDDASQLAARVLPATAPAAVDQAPVVADNGLSEQTGLVDALTKLRSQGVIGG